MGQYTPDTYFVNPAHEAIANSRYYLKDFEGNPVEKNIFETFARVNNYVFQKDSPHRDAMQRLCEEKKFMYAGRPLAQAGTGIENMFNCFVLGIGDSREEISECKRIHFHIQAHGGGTGINFSKLRPSGSWCKGANARSSGPEGFITAISFESANIQQGGNRSGANMGILEDWHPGLLGFITKKSRSNWENIRKFAVVTNENLFKQWQWVNPYAWQTFNVSVGLSDDFMKQVKRQTKKPWHLKWDDEVWKLWDFHAVLRDYTSTGEEIDDPITITVVAPNREIALHEAMNQIPFRNATNVGLELDENSPYELTAYEWFEKICTNAWEDGCPGIFFIDRAREYHNGEYFNKLHATNPCYAGDQYLLTSKGYTTFEELYRSQERVELIQDARVQYVGPEKDNNNPNYWKLFPDKKGYVSNRSDTPVFLTKKAVQIVKVTTTDGLEVRCTPDHHMAVMGKGMVEAGNLLPDDKIMVADTPLVDNVNKTSLDYIIGNLYGLFLGDGHLNTSDTSDKVLICLWGNDRSYATDVEKMIQQTYDSSSASLKSGGNGRELSPYFTSSVSDRNEIRISSTFLKKVFQEHGIFDGQDKYHFTHGNLNKSEFFAGLFSGLFFTDGTVSYNTVNKNLSIRFCSSRPEMLKRLQREALVFGSLGRLYRRRLAQAQEMPDGKGGQKVYHRKASYELIFSGLSRDRLVNLMDLTGEKSTKYIECRSAISDSYRTFWSKVKSVVPDGIEDVYCIAENNRRTVVVNGLTGRRCAEQILPEWSVCCLSSIVLPEFVDEDGEIDWDGLQEAVALGVRALNHITLLNKTDVERIDENTQRERRIGLGTIGMHEILIQIALRTGEDIRYSNEEGRKLAKKVLKFIKHSAYEASIDMAKEIGPFPEFKYEEFVKSKFVQQLLKERPDLDEKLREYGIANVTILTQAPTGTTGTITGYSSGCEPYFAMAYQRNSNVGTILDGCPSFIEWMTDKGINFADHHYNLKELRRHKRIPKVFEEAQDISWQDHLAMQAIFAEQVDSSVSKCLAEGTLINTNQGLMPIEQCGEARGEDKFGNPVTNLMVIDENGKHQKVLSHYSAGEKEATRVTLENGASICGATSSHKVKTIYGWKTLGNLRQDDLVFVNDEFEVLDSNNALPINVDFARNTNASPVKLPEKMSVYLAKLLGMLAADGHLEESTGKVSLYEKSGLGGFYGPLAEDLFGVRPEVHEDPRTGVIEHRITSRVLVRYLRDLIGYRCDDKKVPNQILRGSFAEKQDFIEGLTLDGYLRPGRGLVVYEGKSKLLAYQTAEMLRSFGVPRVYCGKKFVKEYDYYVYSVMVSEKLQEVIVPLELHKHSVPCYRKRNQLVTFDPEDLETLPIATTHPHYSAVRNLRQRNLNYCTKNLAQALGLSITGRVEKIASIEDAGKVPMYDIEVEDSHNYLVSGIVSHNTINLPNKATVKDIMEAYVEAYDMGIKSTTVYRDGSKVQILESMQGAIRHEEGLRPKTIISIPAPRRPDDMVCDIHTVSIKGEKWKVLVGLMHGRPYETFAFPEDQIELPPSKTEGTLIRNGGGKYKLEIPYGDDKLLIKDVASFLLTDEHRMITRLLSTSLRHGAPLNALVSQLSKCDGEVTAFSKALMRVLRKYISDEEYLATAACQQCGSKNLILQEGCLKCSDCNFSGCG